MSSVAFLNGQFIPEEKTVLHVQDLSIQRGYGIFDFLKVQNSIPVFFEEHLDRFYFYEERMRLTIDYSKDELKKIMYELLKKNSASNTGVRITLTGGYSEDGFQLSKPNLIICPRSFSTPTKEQFEKGIKLITYEHQRQLPEVKSIDYLMAIWLQPLVRQHEADDILYHKDGIVSECPRSNFFILKDGTIVTPSKNILKGVMRNKLIEIAKAGYKIEETDITIEEVKSANEAFITSTTKIILPVRQVDDYVFPRLNPVAAKLYHDLNVLQLQQKEASPQRF